MNGQTWLGIALLGLAAIFAVLGGRFLLTAPPAEAQPQGADGVLRELQALGPEDPLDAYLPFFETDYWEQARSAARRVRTRQQDAVRLLASDRPSTQFYALAEFDLRPTREFCEAYRGGLTRWMADFDAATSDFSAPVTELAVHDANLRWFVDNGCDLRPQALAIAAALRRLGESRDMADALERIGHAPLGAAPSD